MNHTTGILILSGLLSAAPVAWTDDGLRTPGATCGAATYEITALPYNAAGLNTFSAVDDYRPTGCPGVTLPGSGFGSDVAYRIQTDGNCTLRVTVDPPGFGSYDPSVYVVTDCASIASTCLVFADALGSFGTETVDFAAAAGTTYYVIVDDSYCSGGGSYPTCSGTGGISYDFTIAVVSGSCANLVPVELQTFAVE